MKIDENSLFYNRVFLEEEFQKELFTKYTTFCGSLLSAANRLGLTLSTYHRYETCQRRTIPIRIYYKIYNEIISKHPELVDKFPSRPSLLTIKDIHSGNLSKIKMDEKCIFYNRVTLEKEFQEKIFSEYAKRCGSIGAAAKSLGLNPATYTVYMKCRDYSVPQKIYYGVSEKLKIENSEQYIKSRTTLSRIRGKAFTKLWKENKDGLLLQAKEASKLGIQRLQENYGDEWGYYLASRGWDGLKEKYGNNYRKKLGELAHKAVLDKYGSNEKIVEIMREGLEKKYGKESWRILMPKARRTLKEKYGDKFILRYYKVIWGDNWKAIFSGYRTQKKNFQFLNEDIEPVFVAIAEATGYKGIKIVGTILQNERLTDKEISKIVRMDIMECRKILSKLNAMGIVKYYVIDKDTRDKIYDYQYKYLDKEKRATEFYVDKTSLEHVAKKYRKITTDRIVSFISKEKELNLRCDCGFKINFEEAFDINFKCPKCFNMLNMKEPSPFLQLLETKLMAEN